jgi:hypothetical protein
MNKIQLDKICSIIFIICLIPYQAIKANDANLSSEGGNIFPLRHSTVQMASENVVIDIFKDTINAICKFKFFNHSDTGQQLLMGFPASACVDTGEEIDALYIRNFSTKITGNIVPVEYKESTQGFDSSFLLRERFCRATPGWYFWKSYIHPNDTLIVINTYSGDLEPISYGSVTVAYTIGTGATWYKNITTGKITFRLDKVCTTRFLISHSENAKIYEDSIVYVFENLKPAWEQSFFVKLVSFWKYPHNEIGIEYGIADYIKNLNKTKKELRLMRDEIFARHGYIFKDEDLRKYFKSKSWYCPNLYFSMDSLSKFEKEIIAALKKKELQP